jgi:hypothetical protein
LVALLLVTGCNNNSFSGSSKSAGQGGGENNRPGGLNGDKNPGGPGNEGTPSSGDKSNKSDKNKPADKIDSSSEESCKNTLMTTGFKDPLNGKVYRMLDGKYNFCEGHKQCDDISKNARFPLVGEKASDDILRCGAVTKSWLDVKADQQREMCDGARIKKQSRLALTDDAPAKQLSLYTFEADRYVSADEEFPIICVYKE